jgi:hypothetical protein
MKYSYSQTDRCSFASIVVFQDSVIFESFRLFIFDYQLSYEHKPKSNNSNTIVRTTGIIVKIRNIMNIYFNTLFTLRSEVTSLSSMIDIYMINNNQLH